MSPLRLAGPHAADSLAVRATPAPVLLVDDNPAKRLALKSVLAPLGYSILEADSGLAALRCVMAQDFAVILLDVCMPIMDGFETAARIRQRPRSEMTPIIFITAHRSDEIIDTDRYAEGAVDFIFAPVAPEELRAKVSVFANLFSKAEELAAKAREVQKSADQLRMLTDAAPIGIFQTDADDRYVYTNPRWTEITGITPEAAVGQRWDPTITTEDPPGVNAEPVDTDADQVSYRVEIEVAGSTPRVVVATSKAISDGAGGVAGRVGTLADVTAEAAAEVVLSDARDNATEASRLKSDFLANMSHEIRTPMNGVIGMADLLLETELDSRQRDYAQTVRNSGEALLTVINDILDFSKVEAGKLEIEAIEFELQNIVDDVVDLLAGVAQTKGLELVSVVESTVPASVTGDPGRVRQVLTNLIGNAIKFTQSGEIVLRVSTAVAVGADTIVRFEVSDTGDGIASEKLGFVFQPFVQADTSTSRRYGGTGLGLAISSQLVDLMGGDCGVSSVLDVGSTFWFTIPFHASAVHGSDGLSVPDADLAGATALIVDDNATQRSVLARYLSDWGMAVTTVDSGLAALESLRAAASDDRPFAVVVIDRTMPGMDGLELKDAIVADSSLEPNMVLLTDLVHDRRSGDVAQADVVATLSKPVHRAELRACLRVALGFEPATPVAAHVAVASTPASADVRAGRVLLAEDNLINQKVAVAMLSSAGYRVDTVLDGAAAVRAVATQAYDAILMDCQMPELNGYEATAAIRAQEGDDRHTPIIAMTAGARREDRDRCLAEGMDGYVAKPVSKDALVALVARSVNRSANGSGNTESVAASMPRAAPASTAEITIDPVVLEELRLLGEATEQNFLVELVAQFVDDTDSRLRELRDAAVAGDNLAVARVAHTIKGSCGQLGGRRLALSCGRLERKALSGRLTEGHGDLQELEFDYQELCHALDQQLSSGERRMLGAEPVEPARPVLDDVVVARLQRLGTAAGEDLLGQLAVLFLTEADGWIVAFRDALARRDAGALMRTAHTLRGAAANLGASELARLCATAETESKAGSLEGAEARLGLIEAEMERVRHALIAAVSAR